MRELSELVEAAARGRDAELAHEARGRLTQATQPYGSDDGSVSRRVCREQLERTGRAGLLGANPSPRVR